MSRYARPSPVIGEDGLEQFLVDKIVSRRIFNGVLQYKVRWKGYPPSDDLWKDADEIKEDCAEIIKEFEESRNRRNQPISGSTFEKSKDSTSESYSQLPESEIIPERLSGRPASKEFDKNFSKFHLSSSGTMQEPILSSVSKIEAEISEIDEDVEDPSSSGAINIQSHKAHRLPIDRGRIHPVKPDPEERVEDEVARSSHGSSGRSSVTISVPPDAKLLKKMVEEKEVEVCFCDIGKQLRFGLTNGGAVVYVYPDNKFPLENLTQEMIKFPYAVIQRLDSKELRILVKLKGNRHSVVDYSLNKFFTKFENLSLSFLNVINHYRRTQTEISNRIEKFENLVKINRDIWNEHAYNQAKELLPDDQIVPHLPEVHATSKNPASTIVEDFLNEMMDNNEHLYFFKLAKEFGKIMSRSSEACAAIEQILYLFETREKQFKSIKKNQIREWCECWTTLFTAQD